MPTPTDNYGWEKPDVGGSAGSWGNLLNTIVDAIDSVLHSASQLASGALQRSGGHVTGPLRVRADEYDLGDLGSMSGAVTLDMTVCRFFHGTVAGDTTFQFANVPLGTAVFIMVEITNGAAHTITWPGTVKWPRGAAPDLTSAGVDLVALYTRDGGATWRGALAQKDSK